MQRAECATGSVLRKVGFGISTLLKLYMVLEWELLDDATISLKDRDWCICSYSTCSVSAYQSIIQFLPLHHLAPSKTHLSLPSKSRPSMTRWIMAVQWSAVVPSPTLRCMPRVAAPPWRFGTWRWLEERYKICRMHILRLEKTCQKKQKTGWEPW